MSEPYAVARGSSSRPAEKPLLRRANLPAITLPFWLLTILTAGLGQAVADWLIGTGNGLPGLGLGGALGIEAGLFVLALALQLTVRRYVPAVYWLAVIGVSIFGTLIPDVMHFAIGIPSWALPPIYGLILAIAFSFWYRADRSLSVNTLRTRRRESTYWVAVLFIFALGTSLVDLVTLQWHVGSLAAAIGFAVAMVAVGALYTRIRRAAVPLFWLAYVIARPLAGSLSDWLIHDEGVQARTVTLVGSILAVVTIGSSTVTYRRGNKQQSCITLRDRCHSRT